jgi:hypothetical protein
VVKCFVKNAALWLNCIAFSIICTSASAATYKNVVQVCTCPVYTRMLAQERPNLRDALLGVDMVTADGMPVVWLQRWLGFAQAERVYGPNCSIIRNSSGACCVCMRVGGKSREKIRTFA